MAEPVKATPAKPTAGKAPDETATQVSPEDQAAASEPAPPAPQDNGSDTSGTESLTDTGRGAGLHR